MLRIRVLGELSVEADGVALEPPTGRPARALLGWLALHPGVHARSTVAGTLWPDVLEESSRRSLRNALSLARRALGSSGGALVATRETIALSAEPDVWVDVRAFDQLAAARQHEAALEVCRGELLAGLDDDWVLSARDRHRERQAELLAALAAAAEAAGDFSIAVGFARRRAALDPLDEPAHRDLMRTLAADGDRAGALVTYAALAERLRHELGIAASVQTRAFAQQLRREPPTPASASGGADVDRACGDPRPQFPIRCVQARRRGDLLGRAAELAHLRERWKLSVGSGGMRLVVLTGEAGIGKTRLAAELGAVVHRDGAAVLYGRAEEDPLCPYQPFVEALREAGAGESNTAPVNVALLAPDHAQRDEQAVGASAAATTSGAEMLRLYDAVAGELELAAGSQPLLLILDDLHWADRGTLRLLSHLAARPRCAVSMLLVTYRDTELGERHPLPRALAELRRDVPVDRVPLTGLSISAVEDVLARSLGHRPSPKTASALHEQTAGNPFFVEELTRSLSEGDLDDLRDGHPRVPEGAAEAVARRVARLGTAAQALLSAAAVIGADFDLRLAAEVVGLPVAAALEALDGAAKARIVSDGDGAPDRYSFVHALTRDALTDALGAGRRARLHALIATAIAPRAQSDPDRYLQLQAHHALAAAPVGDPAAAVALAQRAAARASRVCAYEDAAALLRRGLGVLDGIGAHAHRRAELLCALGEALERSGASSSAQEAFDEASRLARSIGDGRLLARAALGTGGIAITIFAPDSGVVGQLEAALDALDHEDDAWSARLLARLAVELAYDAAGDRRDQASREAVSRARASGDAGALAAALGARHVALWGPEYCAVRLDCAGEMLAAAQHAGAQELELQARNWRALDLLELGRGAELRTEVRDYATLASRARLPSYSWYVPMWRATLALMDGRMEEAMQFARREREMGKRAGDTNAEMCFIHHRFTRLMLDERHGELLGDFYADDLSYATEKLNSPAGPAYRTTLAWLCAATGRLAQARSHFELVAADNFSAIPYDVNWLGAIASAADAALALGDRRRARCLLELMEPYGERIAVSARGSAFRGSLSRLIGQLAAMLGDTDAADAHYIQARHLDERLGAPTWVAHDLWRHGELRLAVGDGPGAIRLLERAVATARAAGLQEGLARIEQAKAIAQASLGRRH